MKKASNSDVTVIIAALNEEKGIGPTLRELREALEDPFYLVVDGNRRFKISNAGLKLKTE